MPNFTYFGPVQVDGGFGTYVILTTGPHLANGTFRFFTKDGVELVQHSGGFTYFTNSRSFIEAPPTSATVEIASDVPLHASCYEFEKKGSNINPVAIFNLKELYLFPPTLGTEG